MAMCGWELAEGVGGASLKDTKVLIRQRGERGVCAGGGRLWNGQAYIFFILMAFVRV